MFAGLLAISLGHLAHAIALGRRPAHRAHVRTSHRDLLTAERSPRADHAHPTNTGIRAASHPQRTQTQSRSPCCSGSATDGRHRRGRRPARTRALPRPCPHIRASLRQKRIASLLPGLVDAESAASDHLAVCARVLCAFVERRDATARM